ncbi:MAG: type II toxin-antitoxin system VapC family toxin [Microcystis aeruginosa]
MKTIFADTVYWVALINNLDDWHEKAIEMTRKLQQVTIVTTDEVFIEVFNNLSAYGMSVRRKTLQVIKGLQNNPQILVIPQTHQTFQSGLDLYQNRPDKDYSLTDCISMQTMRQMNINEILTHDKHFTQEGFFILFQNIELH